MKKFILLFTILSTINLFAQPPQGFNYSAVARDATGKPLANRNVSVQLSILKTSPTGALQYAENHLVNTDGYGLFNLVVGNGNVITGNLTTILWGSANHYLKVAIDANGGSNYITMGTTQIMSVPYALHAKTAESVVGGGTGNGGFTHYIGEQFGGGVIFHLWKDAQGIEHGLIVDLNDLGQEVWSNISTQEIGSTAQSTWDGLSNSSAIIGQAGHTNSAAALCLNTTNSGQSDWYLPSIDELNLLWNSRFNVNKTLSTIGGATTLTFFYWSSSEGTAANAWYFPFSNGVASNNSKTNPRYVRAVRAF
jgi:hypothetical protein